MTKSKTFKAEVPAQAERVVRYLVVAVLSVLLFGGLFLGSLVLGVLTVWTDVSPLTVSAKGRYWRFAMDANYMLACGIVWRKTADPEAGWELVEALESPDRSLRLLAQSLLVETGEDSMDLLEDAVARGILSPEVAGPCMAEILRSGQARQTRRQTINQHLGDVLLC